MNARAAPAYDPHCRNCGAATTGHYCANCGQETRVALPTARQFMREATGRLLSWDGRLWRTLYALAFRPGYLTRVYLAGRRRHYVRPARLFLGMSLILFAVIRLEVGSVEGKEGTVVIGGRPPAQALPRAAAKQAEPSPEALRGDMATILGPGFGIAVDDDMNLSWRGSDSIIARGVRERFDRFNRLSKTERVDRIVDGALRYGSYLLFLLLPLFAALMYVAYAGRGHRYPGRPRLYAEHLVYGAHVHTFVFLGLILAIVVPWEPLRWALLAWMVVYVVRARRNVYGGGWFGSAARAVLVGGIYLVAQLVGLAGLFVASILLT